MTVRTRDCSWTAAARRAGIDPDVYARNRRRGRRWCSWCRDFHKADQFSGRASLCRKGACAYQAERKETPRDNPAGPWAVYVADPAERCDRRICGVDSEAEARHMVRVYNAHVWRRRRPGTPQPALYYAVAAEEVT